MRSAPRKGSDRPCTSKQPQLQRRLHALPSGGVTASWFARGQSQQGHVGSREGGGEEGVACSGHLVPLVVPSVCFLRPHSPARALTLGPSLAALWGWRSGR